MSGFGCFYDKCGNLHVTGGIVLSVRTGVKFYVGAGAFTSALGESKDDEELTKAMCDLTAVSDRYGKSITAIEVKGTAVSLPNFPYDMPSEAATLQTDLRAAGYDDATVTSVSAALTVQIRNHTSSGAFTLTVTMSGTNVTNVAFQGTSISLPSYPYSMPSQRATLQTDLRAAGYSGAVVTLHGDPWTIFLPDILAGAQNRRLEITFTPGDPYPAFSFDGTYLGEAPANMVNGTSDNVRTPGGAPLLEANRQFARMAITRGSRVLP